MTALDPGTHGVLLDTHVVLWLMGEPERCGPALETLIDPAVDLWISSASTWELAIKVSLGRLTLPAQPAAYVEDRRQRLGAMLVNIDHRHAGAVAELAGADTKRLFSVPMWASLVCLVLLLVAYPRRTPESA